MLSVFVENFTNGKACVPEISFFEALAQICNLCFVPKNKNPHSFPVVNSYFLSLTLFSMHMNCTQVTPRNIGAARAEGTAAITFYWLFVKCRFA